MNETVVTEVSRSQSQTFAERLRFLFSAVRHPSGRKYKDVEVAEAINSRGTFHISRGYISALRVGLRPIPSMECARAIADFFEVPVRYFYDDAIAWWIERELELLAVFRHSPVRTIALEAYGLSESSLQLLLMLTKHMRRLEGLPETRGPVRERAKGIVSANK